MFYTTDFGKLTDEVIKKQGHDTLFMSFSTGKDSLASFLRCIETGKFKDSVLFYYYLIPNLSWIEEYLTYFEQKYNLEIIRVPNPNFYKMMNNVVLQTPSRIKAVEKLTTDGDGFPVYDFTELTNAVKYHAELPINTLCAVGVKSADSMLRRTAIMKHGIIIDSVKKWYPIHDFSNQDIKDIMKKHDLEYPADYELFGMTFDGLDYRFVKVIKEKRPEDYEKIRQWFPLIDLIIARRERYIGTELKRTKFNYLT